MKTYIFKMQKGGTGATSIICSIAVELAKAGKKTILIDADPQGNATTWNNFPEVSFDLADVLIKKATLQQAILKTSQDNLFIIPTIAIGGTLTSDKERVCNNEPFIMQDICDELSKTFDYCFIDLSPSFGNFERSCYMASDEIIPVLLLDEFSTGGLSIFNEHLQEIRKSWRIPGDKMQFNKVVLNKMNKTKSVSKVYLDQFNKTYSQENLFIIPQDPIFEKAQIVKIPIQDADGTKTETLQELKRLATSL